jgi:hypothetical protein
MWTRDCERQARKGDRKVKKQMRPFLHLIKKKIQVLE